MTWLIPRLFWARSKYLVTYLCSPSVSQRRSMNRTRSRKKSRSFLSTDFKLSEKKKMLCGCSRDKIRSSRDSRRYSQIKSPLGTQGNRNGKQAQAQPDSLNIKAVNLIQIFLFQTSLLKSKRELLLKKRMQNFSTKDSSLENEQRSAKIHMFRSCPRSMKSPYKLIDPLTGQLDTNNEKYYRGLTSSQLQPKAKMRLI